MCRTAIHSSREDRQGVQLFNGLDGEVIWCRIASTRKRRDVQSGRTTRIVSHQRPSPPHLPWSEEVAQGLFQVDARHSDWLYVWSCHPCHPIIACSRSPDTKKPRTKTSSANRVGQMATGRTHLLLPSNVQSTCWARLEEQSRHYYSTSSSPLCMYCMTSLFFLSASTLKPILTLVCHRIYASDGASFASSYVLRHGQW